MWAAGGGRESSAAAVLRVLLIATACGFVFALLHLPLPDGRARSAGPGGGERGAGGGGGVRLSAQQGRIPEARLSVVTEEIDVQTDEIAAEEDERISKSPPDTKEKIWMMQDQLLMAKAYLHFASPQGSVHLVRELRLRIKEIERAISHSSGGTHVPASVLQKMKAMELTLSKAQRTYPRCSQMTSKLRAMMHNSEELFRAHQSESSFLEQVAVRTLPKGHHCLAMQLTAEYFSLDPIKREFPKRDSIQLDGYYHYAIFSDNVLASAVVVNSTIAASKDPGRIILHIVTDALNYPAMMMWFLTNPPTPAAIQIKSLDDLKWLPGDFSSRFKMKGVRDPRYTSALNHLRFYLPEVFPSLSKVVLLDHDVVVQNELTGLWDLDMKGKIIGAVETCTSSEGYHRLDSLVDFSNPNIFSKLDPKACAFAFGMNIFDLNEWRKQGLTETYHKWFQLGKIQKLWKAGSLPLSQLIFYNKTLPLDHRWHVLGLGHDFSIGRNELESASVIHYSGKLKPWLEISIPKYRDYWNRYLNYDNPHLQQCNIHG
ncbi:probable galacturonosyltransferase 4 [Miscanthus floridulus]|uniref:probable galacturonosyltransferase 4 n=1 Tax=Miscanthus floridulus TaxID=154761 RepID=UPI003458ABD6